MSAHAAPAIHTADSYENKFQLWIVLAASMTGTLMQALAVLLRRGGRFVFSVTHPCFQMPRLPVADEQR